MEHGKILYCRQLKERPCVRLSSPVCSATLKLDYFTGKFAAITAEHYIMVDGKKCWMYDGFLLEQTNSQELEFTEDSFLNSRKFTVGEATNIEHPIPYMNFIGPCLSISKEEE